MLTVACVWVKANVPYTVDYVVRLQSMVKRFLPLAHRFVCLTDRPTELPSDVETITVRHNPVTPGWWAKIHLFSKDTMKYHISSERILYFDLDTVIVNDLTPIAKQTADLALLPTEGNFQGRGGLRVIKKFNSSVMSYDLEKCKDLSGNFSASVARRLWGDQDWIAEQMPDATTMPLEWFPRYSAIKDDMGPPRDARVVLCKRPKNHEAAEHSLWVKEAWA